MTSQIFLQNKQRDVRLSNIALLILPEIANLQNFLLDEKRDVRCSARNFVKSSFSDVRKFGKAGLPTVRQFSRIRGIAEQRLGYLFVSSSSSHFFNITDLELLSL